LFDAVPISYVDIIATADRSLLFPVPALARLFVYVLAVFPLYGSHLQAVCDDDVNHSISYGMFLNRFCDATTMKPKVKRNFQRAVVDPEKKRQRRVLYFSLFMVALMVMGIFGYIQVDSTGENQMMYGDYEFVYRDLGGGAGVLVTTIGSQEVEFQNLPTQVSFLEIEPAVFTIINAAPQIVLTADMNLTPEDAATINYAWLQLGLALQKTANAMMTPDERYKLPVINCSAATAQMPVLVFNVTNATSLYADGYCLYLNAEARDILRYKDRIIFENIGILKNGVVVEQ